MNIVLWILQALLAAHTAMGAVWKFTNSEQSMGSLSAIPHALWLTLGVIEIVCAVALLLPAFYKKACKVAPYAALFVAAEMLLFTGIHLASGDTNYGPVGYWLVVAAISAFIAYGRCKLCPHNR